MERYVRCKNKSERDLILKRLEDAGYHWLSGHKPTELSYWDGCDYNSNVFIINDKDKTLANGWDYALDQISAADFLKTLKDSKDAPIAIYRNGDVMTAVDKATKKVGKATCGPSDEFDRYTGAMIALCRLVGADIGEDAYKVMRQLLGDEMEHEEQELKDDEIKVGDCVRVINRGKVCRYYAEWIEKHVLNMDDAIHFCYGEPTPDNDNTTYTVLVIAKHGLLEDTTLCYIKNNFSEKCYLIGIDGLEKV